MPASRLALTAALALLTAPAAPAGFYTYTFTGQVTAVDNPNGFFAAPAAVGAPVSGSFTYTDTPNAIVAFPPPDPYFFSYPNSNEPGSANRTGLSLVVGGLTATAPPSSLTDMIVGNDNPTDGLLRPAGDSFRLADQLSIRSPLFDQAALLNAEFPHFSLASIFLADPAGAAFDSLALPQGGLPLAALTRRYGVIDIFDDEFTPAGQLQFRIDSIQPVAPVPVPPAAALALVGGLTAAFARRRLAL